MSSNCGSTDNDYLSTPTRIGTFQILDATPTCAYQFLPAATDVDSQIRHKDTGNRAVYVQFAPHWPSLAEPTPKPNVLSPISRLPNELMSTIFSFYVALFHDDVDNKSPNYNLKAQVTITHVCHRWRILALNQPELWTNVDSRDIEFVESMLTRSGSGPLKIRIKNPEAPLHKHDLSDWLMLYAADKERIQELELWSFPIDPKDKWNNIAWFTENADRLHSVVYHSLTPSRALTHNFVLNAKSNPAPVKHLTCHGLDGASTLSSFFKRTLTHLCINGYGRALKDFSPPTVGPPESHELSGALRAAVNLTELDLNLVDFTRHHPSIGSITLPHLRRLCIKDNSTSMTSLLNGLHFPTSARLQLLCTEQWPIIALPQMCLAIASKLMGLGQLGAYVPFVTLNTTFIPCAFVRAWTQSDTSEPYNFSLGFPHETPSSEFADLNMAMVINVIKEAMSQVQTIRIGPRGRLGSRLDPPMSHGRPFVVALQSLQNVQDLRIYRASDSDVCRFLVGHSFEEDTLSAPFPRLKRLTLSECAFDASSCGCNASGALEDDSAAEANVTTALDPVSIRQMCLPSTQGTLDELNLWLCRNLCECNMKRMSALARTVKIESRPEPADDAALKK